MSVGFFLFGLSMVERKGGEGVSRGGGEGGWRHKVLTYVEYRAVSGVFQNIYPPGPLPPLPGGEGGGVNILEDARHRIGLLEYNLSTDGGLHYNFRTLTQRGTHNTAS
jgi:hypothetical protein